MKKEDSTEQNWSRRNFLRTMGAGVPTLSLIGRGVDARDSFGAGTAQEYDKNKFSPLDLRSSLQLLVK